MIPLNNYETVDKKIFMACLLSADEEAFAKEFLIRGEAGEQIIPFLSLSLSTREIKWPTETFLNAKNCISRLTCSHLHYSQSNPYFHACLGA